MHIKIPVWHIERIINFGKSGQFKDGFARFGFHDTTGNQYLLAHDHDWIGALSGDDKFLWTAGKKPPYPTSFHYDIEIIRPTFLTECNDGALLVAGKNGIHRLDPAAKHARMLIRAGDEGLDFIGNSVVDDSGCIWINDICGCRIFKYSSSGSLLEVVGSGKPGFARKDLSFADAEFNWIYDIRKGSDGNIYVLDSRNYAVRMLDVQNRTVRLVAGTGEPGYSGDGGDPLEATFGGNEKEQFDGPWSLSIDEEDNIYIGDTQNHVLRMIERSDNTIVTIAGKREAVAGELNSTEEKNPFNLNLPRICGLDYAKDRLFIPEWDGDLVVLKRGT